ncbi:hypothetical protein Nepgr_031951 [Nepenthes gracilis]|uniref:Secreted protein n=1 Tax=Nepenthes gracilis TaxID=150966 RepID=A0AAD3THP7_NEPGR|nr:hypothetical protein Nepgr_031951 [Nepenthes gracilis]
MDAPIMQISLSLIFLFGGKVHCLHFPINKLRGYHCTSWNVRLFKPCLLTESSASEDFFFGSRCSATFGITWRSLQFRGHRSYIDHL